MIAPMKHLPTAVFLTCCMWLASVVPAAGQTAAPPAQPAVPAVPAQLTVPAGFTVTVFASDVTNGRLEPGPWEGFAEGGRRYPPALALQPHSSPIDLRFYTGDHQDFLLGTARSTSRDGTRQVLPRSAPRTSAPCLRAQPPGTGCSHPISGT